METKDPKVTKEVIEEKLITAHGLSKKEKDGEKSDHKKVLQDIVKKAVK